LTDSNFLRSSGFNYQPGQSGQTDVRTQGVSATHNAASVGGPPDKYSNIESTNRGYRQCRWSI